VGTPPGAHFEAEIGEQPQVWERLADGDLAGRLAAALTPPLALVGSGSSLFAAQLGAMALRRRRVDAAAVAATEVSLDHRAYEGRTVIAISQSGSSTDLLAALERLRPRRIVALTNTADSPLAARADETIDVGAGPERAVPASKSVSATVALLLWAASLVGGDGSRDARRLRETAQATRAWLGAPGRAAARVAGAELVARRGVAILGSDYGLPVARETALKLKEAAYLHAEAFAAGEFRHGSVAMIDPAFAVLGIVDRDGLAAIERAMAAVARTGAARYLVGTVAIGDITLLGPVVDDAFNVLASLVTGQALALDAARARGVDSDAPRGLTKAVIDEG
jgi:glucosamine--fructose-6-phosphate aminotransferase (isomerizing)